jgi:ComF family protein
MDLPWIGGHCRQCGVPLETETVESCGQCCQAPPPFWSVVSPLIYEFPVNRLVQALKFRRQLAEGRVLSHLMAEYIYHQGLDLPDVLIPVPLHRWRLLKRGFNQAFELAEYMSRMLGIRLDATSLKRNRYTRAQSGLSRTQRLRNVRGAFHWQADHRACRHVVLVDDVMTTGTTVIECTRVLLNAGARRVDIWVAARAAPPGKQLSR